MAAYGHVGLNFNADTALKIGELRDRRYKDTYDKILLRCLKQIQVGRPHTPFGNGTHHWAQGCCSEQKSIIFEVPPMLSADLQPYDTAEVLEYLVVALRDDRKFRVVKVDERRLYIRWAPLPEKRPPTPKHPRTAVARDRIAAKAELPTHDDLREIDRLIAELDTKK